MGGAVGGSMGHSVVGAVLQARRDFAPQLTEERDLFDRWGEVWQRGAFGGRGAGADGGRTRLVLGPRWTLRDAEDLHTQPLLLAVAAHQVQAAELLLAAGADVDRRSADKVEVRGGGERLDVDRGGRHALEVAARHGNAAMALLLLRHGAACPVEFWFEDLFRANLRLSAPLDHASRRLLPKKVEKLVMGYISGSAELEQAPHGGSFGASYLDHLEEWAVRTVRDQRAMAAALFRVGPGGGGGGGGAASSWSLPAPLLRQHDVTAPTLSYFDRSLAVPAAGRRNDVAPKTLLREALHIAGVRRKIVSFLVVHELQRADDDDDDDDDNDDDDGGEKSRSAGRSRRSRRSRRRSSAAAEAATRRAAIELTMRFHGLRMVLGRRHGPRGMVRLQGLGNAQMNGVVAWGLGFNIATGRFKIEIETKTAALEGGGNFKIFAVKPTNIQFMDSSRDNMSDEEGVAALEGVFGKMGLRTG